MNTSSQDIFGERRIIHGPSQLQSSDQKPHRRDGDLTGLGSLGHIWQLLFYGTQKPFHAPGIDVPRIRLLARNLREKRR